MWWREVRELAGMLSLITLLGVAGVSLSRAAEPPEEGVSGSTPDVVVPVVVERVSPEPYEAVAPAPAEPAPPVG